MEAAGIEPGHCAAHGALSRRHPAEVRVLSRGSEACAPASRARRRPPAGSVDQRDHGPRRFDLASRVGREQRLLNALGVNAHPEPRTTASLVFMVSDRLSHYCSVKVPPQTGQVTSTRSFNSKRSGMPVACAAALAILTLSFLSAYRASGSGRASWAPWCIGLLRVVPSPPTRPHARWCMDFVQDSLIDGRKFRALTVVDMFTRNSFIRSSGIRTVESP